MIYTHGMFPTYRQNAERDGYSILEAAGYVKTISQGCIALLPLGQRVLEKISMFISACSEEHGFSRVSLPLLQRRELWEESGRAAKYPGLLCETSIGDKPFVINPTQEEAMLDLFRMVGFGPSELPLRLMQIGERVRGEIRPAHGLIRTRCFTLADLYALCRDNAQMETSVRTLDSIMQSIISWAGLPYRRGRYLPSAMGVYTSSYWVPSKSKQCIVPVCCQCGSSFRTQIKLLSCPHCGGEEFEQVEAAEIGDVMHSGTVLSERLKAFPQGKKDPVFVAMAGIGISRLLQLIAEYHSDEYGLAWPVGVAPFHIELVGDERRKEETHNLYTELKGVGYEVMLDERERSLPRKLVDAELFGMPVVVVLGSRTIPDRCEVKVRATGQTIVTKKDELLLRIQELLGKR